MSSRYSKLIAIGLSGLLVAFNATANSAMHLQLKLENKPKTYTLSFTGQPELDNSSYDLFDYLMGDLREDVAVKCDPRLAITLSTLQKRTGALITLLSGYRTEKTNRKMPNGSIQSFHLDCAAVDFVLEGYNSQQTATLLTVISTDLWGPDLGGLGLKGKGVHFDLGARRLWND